MASDLQNRLAELDKSLDEFGTKDSVPTPIANVFNALLGEAKKDKAGDPVVDSMEPVEIGGEFALVDAGALRAVIQQLITATG